MSTTTEPTITDGPPAWLNLEAIVPVEIIESIARSRVLTMNNLEAIREATFSIHHAVFAFDEATDDLPDEVRALVCELSGLAELEQLAHDIAHLFASAANGSATEQEPLERIEATEMATEVAE